MDEMGLLAGAPALEALVRRHPQVEGLICGHLHRSIQARFGGRLVSHVAHSTDVGPPQPF